MVAREADVRRDEDVERVFTFVFECWEMVWVGVNFNACDFVSYSPHPLSNYLLTIDQVGFILFVCFPSKYWNMTHYP